MVFVLNQKASLQGPEWWSWEVFLDGPDADLDQVESVEYLLHPSFPEPSVRTTDRASRFALRNSGWGEFTIRAEVRPRSGAPIHLRHWLRLQPEVSGEGYRILLVDSPGDQPFTDALQSRLEARGFVVERSVNDASVKAAGVVVASVSGTPNPLRQKHFEALAAARKPLVIIRIGDVGLPPCLAYCTLPAESDATTKLASAATWLEQILDRSQHELRVDGAPAISSAFWSNRFALSSIDVRHCGDCFLPMLVRGEARGFALAIAPDIAIAPGEGVPSDDCSLRLPNGEVCSVKQLGVPKDFATFRLSTPVTSFIRLSDHDESDPALAVIAPGTDRIYELRLGWLKAPPTYELSHDVARAKPGSAVMSLESGALLGLQIHPGRALPASAIRQMLPREVALPSLPPTDTLESAHELEARGQDALAGRQGYKADFLGFDVPLPKTGDDIVLLPYTNFSVALHRKRQLSLYAVVNIDGRRTVQQTRSGDPWQLDPRVAGDLQIGKRYYEGTPLDRGHMVRRIDPVWGKSFEQAELDTFYYPNSCPQHKNLNRKTWNDLEDYVYDHLKDDEQKVTVFTGPVLSNSDPVFRKKKLPREFWKVVVIRRPDGKPSATAYLLSQTDMIRGLEFVFGEFRTYQVSVALIEKKTGLDFGNLRTRDPKVEKRGSLETLPPPTEIRSAADLELAFDPPEECARDVQPRGFVWRDRGDFESQLDRALESFDWKATDELVEALIVRLSEGSTELDTPFANRTLAKLQRKRRFASASRAGDAFIQAGLAKHQVRRRYAQALIECGTYHAASLVLRNITLDGSAPPAEQQEAQGLLGRISKQIYVNFERPKNPRNVAELQTAVDAYWLTYSVNPTVNLWHGINVTACLCRAREDGITLRASADPLQIAGGILEVLKEREESAPSGSLEAWDLATMLEAALALGDHAEAVKRAKLYVLAKGADAFEIASTLRQLEEVWRLRDDAEPGGSVLPILRAALLKQSGGSLQLSPDSANSNLQKVLGDDSSLSLKWYRQGLKRARSVARIERNGTGVGTGWVIDLAHLVPGKSSQRLLVTNAHVIGPDTPDRYPEALRPEDATANFLMLEEDSKFGKVLFHSPVNELDTTIIELERLPEKAAALELDASVLKVATPPQRLYMIGCPDGRGVEFSLQDNFLLEATDRLVHYRTPSEPGSSGSPVFGPVDWKVTALHHAGSREMPRIDGTGSHEANEGIALAAIRAGVAVTLA